MKLDLFNNLINSAKENNVIQSFLKELGAVLEKNLPKESQVPVFEKMLNEAKLTVRYRDKINTEKVNILRNYAKETVDKGKMYYVYGKDINYRLGIYGEEIQEEREIEVEENKLPEDVGTGSILREKNGKFILDKETTALVQGKMTEMINTLLQEQSEMIEGQRIDGHLYEFVEEGKNKVWLMDKTNYTGECIEEFDFPKEILKNAEAGDIFQYINGKYQIYSKG